MVPLSGILAEQFAIKWVSNYNIITSTVSQSIGMIDGRGYTVWVTEKIVLILKAF